MTTDNLLDAMGLLDERTVADAKRYPLQPLPRKAGGRRRARRIALLAAVLSLLFAVTAYALGGPGGIFTSRLPRDWGKDRFESLPYYEKEAGFSIQAVEEFSNGYRFREMALERSAVVDEGGSTLDEYLGIALNYEKEDGPDLYLSVTPRAESDEANASPPTETRELDGVPVQYCRSAYKVVPEGYRPTEEDAARQAAGELTISYGSSAVKETYVCSVLFCLEDTRYCLLCLSDLDADVMFRMAEELLAA